MAEDTQAAEGEFMAETQPEEAQAAQPPAAAPEQTYKARTTIDHTVPASAMGQQQPARSVYVPRPKENTIVQGDREFIDQLMRDGSSMRWRCAVYRFGPTRWAGKLLKMEHNYTTSLMTYDQLYDDVAAMLGSGGFRVAIVDKSGNVVNDAHGKPLKAIVFDIPTSTDCPPHDAIASTVTLDPEAPETPAPVAAAPADPIERQFKIIRLEELEEERKINKRKRERKEEAEDQIAQLTAKKVLAALLKDDSPPPAPVGESPAVIEARIRTESDQKIAQMRAEFQLQLATVVDQLKSIPTTIKEAVSAVAPKEGAGPSAHELMVTMQTTMQTQQMEFLKVMVPAMTQKPPDNGSDKVFELMKTENSQSQKLLQSILPVLLDPNRGKPASGGSDIEMALKYMEMGRKGMREVFEMAEKINGGGAAAAAAAISEEGEGGSGSQIISGITKVAEAALGNSALANMLQAWLERKAAPQQQTINVSPQQQRFIAPPQNPRLQGPPPVQRPLVTPSAPQSESFTVPVAQEGVLEAEPEQTNAPQEIVVPAAESAVVPTPTAPAAEEEFDMDTLEGRTRFYVTDSIKIAISDIVDGRAKRSWVEDALGYWPRPFLEQVIAAPDDNARTQLISAQCSEAVIDQFSGMLQANSEELKMWYNHLSDLVSAAKGAAPAASATTQPVEAPAA